MHLVCLGSAITVAAAAFGPFAQQVVTYSLRLHPVGTAQAQQVLNYTDGDLENPSLEVYVNEDLILGTTNLSAVVPSCSTGYCSWSEYSSLGICSSVSDVSSELLNMPCNLTAFEELFEQAGMTNPGYPCYNYSLPTTELSMSASLSALDKYRVANTTISNTNTFLEYDTPGFMQTMNLGIGVYRPPTFMSAYLTYQPGLSTSLNSSLPPPIAYELDRDFCIQTYNTSVLDTVVNTTLVSSRLLDLNFTVQWNTSDTSAYWGGNSTSFEVWLDGKDFAVSPYTLINLFINLQASLETPCFLLVPTFPGYTEYVSNEGYDWACYVEGPGPRFMLALNSTDPLSKIKDIWDNLAVSLTNSFRVGAGGASIVNLVEGTALAPITFVETNYLWLIFPISLVVFTLVFLVATIMQTKSHGSRVWKSSNLATLQGLSNELHNDLGGLTTATEMEQRSRDVEVRLDFEGGKAKHGLDYRLVQAKLDPSWGF